MKIHVRRRHIEKGKRGRAAFCPIALAYKDITGERPWVNPWCVIVHKKTFNLPAAAQDFIALFDAGKPVKPFAFVLK